MAQFPFTFNAADFYPLQPEDEQREFELRTNPQYQEFYKYIDIWGDGAPVVQEEARTPYHKWLETCKQMDLELEEAKSKWRESVARREKLLSELKIECEHTRMEYKRLAARVKPPQPGKDK